MNKFFKVEKPFRVFRHFGTSASNSYVGASQIFNTVMEGVNTRPGDEIHALVGGTFLLRGNEICELSLVASEAAFEKTYLGTTDAEKLAGRIKHAEVVSIAEPKTKPDYTTARNKASANMLRDYFPEVVNIEPSPRMVELEHMVRTRFLERLDEYGVAYTAKSTDIDAWTTDPP